jgi:hypothetical protein
VAPGGGVVRGCDDGVCAEDVGAAGYGSEVAFIDLEITVVSMYDA